MEVTLINACIGIFGIVLGYFLKNKIQNNEHKHQLTKEKYQSLMDKKIDLYNELSEIYRQHTVNKLKIGSYMNVVDDKNQICTKRVYEEFDAYIDTYYNLNVLIKKYNNLLLSVELYKIFESIKSKKEKMEFILSYEIEECFISYHEIEDEELKKYKEFVDLTKKDFDDLLETIKKETNAIRNKLDLEIKIVENS